MTAVWIWCNSGADCVSLYHPWAVCINQEAPLLHQPSPVVVPWKCVVLLIIGNYRSAQGWGGRLSAMKKRTMKRIISLNTQECILLPLFCEAMWWTKENTVSFLGFYLALEGIILLRTKPAKAADIGLISGHWVGMQKWNKAQSRE